MQNPLLVGHPVWFFIPGGNVLALSEILENGKPVLKIAALFIYFFTCCQWQKYAM